MQNNHRRPTLTCYKKAADPDFWQHGNNGTVFVEVSLVDMSEEPDPDENGDFRVCAWNDDDLGREIDVITYEEAEKIFHTILAEDMISDAFLMKLGFWGA